MKNFSNLCFVSIVLTLLSCNISENNTKKPNIVLILADDLGVPQVGCYGSTFYETPNIDQLALDGVRFTNAYSAAAVCSPTRAALLTGKNPARLHITDFIAGNNRDNYPLKEPDWQKYLELEETTIAELLKAKGYATALFGKWHLSKEKFPPKSLEHNPDKQGFDETFVTYKPVQNYPIGSWQTAENDAHSVDTLTNLAIDFIKRNKTNPFLLILSHNSIHDPIMERESEIGYFEQKAGSKNDENNPVIAAMIKRMDESLGMVLNAIEENELNEQTMVIFYSDNGGLERLADQSPLRKGKGWLYEGGIRVPLIVRWNNVTDAGKTIHDPVTTTDIFSTILDITSTIAPEKNSVEGISLEPLLSNNASLPSRALFWNYPHYHVGTGMKPACAIRDGDYKLIEWYEPKLLGFQGAYELFNLKNDPGESENLFESQTAVANKLILQLDSIKIAVNAQEPVINEHFEN